MSRTRAVEIKAGRKPEAKSDKKKEGVEKDV